MCRAPSRRSAALSWRIASGTTSTASWSGWFWAPPLLRSLPVPAPGEEAQGHRRRQDRNAALVPARLVSRFDEGLDQARERPSPGQSVGGADPLVTPPDLSPPDPDPPVGTGLDLDDVGAKDCFAGRRRVFRFVESGAGRDDERGRAGHGQVAIGGPVQAAGG